MERQCGDAFSKEVRDHRNEHLTFHVHEFKPDAGSEQTGNRLVLFRQERDGLPELQAGKQRAAISRPSLQGTAREQQGVEEQLPAIASGAVSHHVVEVAAGLRRLGTGIGKTREKLLIVHVGHRLAANVYPPEAIRTGHRHPEAPREPAALPPTIVVERSAERASVGSDHLAILPQPD